MAAGYTLEYEIVDTPSSKKTVELLPTILTRTIENLTPTTHYTIYVFASTSKGPGPVKEGDIISGVPPGRD